MQCTGTNQESILCSSILFFKQIPIAPVDIHLSLSESDIVFPFLKVRIVNFHNVWHCEEWGTFFIVDLNLVKMPSQFLMLKLD